MPYGHVDDFKSNPDFYNALKNQNFIATDIFIGKTPPGKTPLDITINGMTVGDLKSTSIETSEQQSSNPEKRLNLKLENNSYRYADITNILDDDAIGFLNSFIIQNKKSLLEIANDYEKRGRQFFNFLYDLVLIFKTLPQLPTEFQGLLNDINNQSEILMHNGIVAHIALLYKNSGYVVHLEPKNMGNKPDLLIDNKFAEIKTILTPKENNQKSLESFAEKMNIHNTKARNQVGKNGMVFISPWSGIINSLFYGFYYDMKNKQIHNFDDCSVFTHIPPFQEGKTVFVVTTPKSFEDYFLVFDSNWIIDAMFLFARSRYKIFDTKANMLDYLKIQPPLREGFPVGNTGDIGISFPIN